MRVFQKGRWVGGFLPYHCGAEDLPIEVVGWRVLRRLRGIYPEPPRTLRTLAVAIKKYGLQATVRKVLSRLAERSRNRKYASIGVGYVARCRTASTMPLYAFLAPCHPLAVDALAVHRSMAIEYDGPADLLCLGAIRLLDSSCDRTDLPEAIQLLLGWHQRSGCLLDALQLTRLREAVLHMARDTDWAQATRYVVQEEQGRRGEPRLAKSGRERRFGKPTASLFGYGQHAKTIVLPYVASTLRVRTVHELDPTQIPRRRGTRVWTTSPDPGPADDTDTWLIAGYHSTHAPMAAEAIRRGIAAVVEKPLAVADEQLDELMSVIRRFPGARVFCAFQLRYSALTASALKDLNVGGGRAVSCECEIHAAQLPPLHWYRWPSSRSRLLSNGCHWLDYFLFLNQFSKPVGHAVENSRDGAVRCRVELENGASLSLMLVEDSSARLGVGSRVVLKAGEVTAEIVDAEKYWSWKGGSILTKTRVPYLEGIRRMYADFGRRIAAGEPGDSAESVETTARLTLQLDRQLNGHGGSSG